MTLEQKIRELLPTYGIDQLRRNVGLMDAHEREAAHKILDRIEDEQSMAFVEDGEIDDLDQF